MIEAAALLANVGYLINFEGHHKHSYHLIVNSELPGFEREQLRLLALVARYHRGSRPKKKHDDFRALGDDDRRRVSAAGRDPAAGARARSHASAARAEVRADVADGSVEITVDAQGDADVDLWAARSKVELFEKVFDREVVFSANDSAAAAVHRTASRAADRSMPTTTDPNEDRRSTPPAIRSRPR